MGSDVLIPRSFLPSFFPLDFLAVTLLNYSSDEAVCVPVNHPVRSTNRDRDSDWKTHNFFLYCAYQTCWETVILGGKSLSLSFSFDIQVIMTIFPPSVVTTPGTKQNAVGLGKLVFCKSQAPE